MNQPTPIPDAVADLKIRQMPPAVRDALAAKVDAEYRLTLCIGDEYAEARGHQAQRLHRAEKVLAGQPTRGGAA